MQEREHGERKLQCQHDLAERQQVRDTAIPAHADDEDSRQNRQSAGNEPAQATA